MASTAGRKKTTHDDAVGYKVSSPADSTNTFSSRSDVQRHPRDVDAVALSANFAEPCRDPSPIFEAGRGGSPMREQLLQARVVLAQPLLKGVGSAVRGV